MVRNCKEKEKQSNILKVTDLDNLTDRGRQARQIIISAGLPNSVRKEIIQQYEKLRGDDGKDVSVAVRSSATAEDLPNASFAGQQASVSSSKLFLTFTS